MARTPGATAITSNAPLPGSMPSAAASRRAEREYANALRRKGEHAVSRALGGQMVRRQLAAMQSLGT
jgi:hypothetical protein